MIKARGPHSLQPSRPRLWIAFTNPPFPGLFFFCKEFKSVTCRRRKAHAAATAIEFAGWNLACGTAKLVKLFFQRAKYFIVKDFVASEVHTRSIRFT